LSYNINIYEMSLANVIKRTSTEIYNVSKMSFIFFLIKMTTSKRSFFITLH